VYVDTRLILEKLESLFPSASAYGTTIRAPLTPSSKYGASVQALLSRFMIDGGGFATAAKLIPLDLPLLNDERFQKDREDFSGTRWTTSAMAKGRPDALVAFKDAFMLVEKLLDDESAWIAGTSLEQGPTLADIEGVWLFSWLFGMKGAVDDVATKEDFPKVFAWVARFEKAVKDAQAKIPKVVNIKGPEIEKAWETAGWGEESSMQVDERDPMKLRADEEVELFPADSGMNHKDKGRLIGLTPEEVVIEKRTPAGQAIRIHAPRRGFRVRKTTWERL
jgi:hypothetical protein